MDFNGDLIVDGSSTYPILSNFGAAASTGMDGENTKGTLTFSNGFKIQWNTHSYAANTEAAASLPEAYTGAQLFVMVCYATNIADDATDSSCSAEIPSGTALSQVQLKNNADTTEDLTYLSFGFDL
jgi:hypothetical protein